MSDEIWRSAQDRCIIVPPVCRNARTLIGATQESVFDCSKLKDAPLLRAHHRVINLHGLFEKRWRMLHCAQLLRKNKDTHRALHDSSYARTPVRQAPQATALGIRYTSLSFKGYVLSNLFSNFWLIFGKLREARSRLYRRQLLQVNTLLKALDEIYKIYTLLHLWNP